MAASESVSESISAQYPVSSEFASRGDVRRRSPSQAALKACIMMAVDVFAVHLAFFLASVFRFDLSPSEPLHPQPWALAGLEIPIHPGYLLGSSPDATEVVDDAALASLRQLLAGPHVAALGEIGLDYHYTQDDAALRRQRESLGQLLQLADQTNAAVVIHNREATDDTLAILREFPRVRAVFHCFTGSSAEADRILAAGYYLGFTGVVSFKKSDELRTIAAAAPADRILVETDAPWLSPEPVRKFKVNEPAFVMHVAAAVAAVRKISVWELDELTTANAHRLFAAPAAQ